jgi:hypothetical protein
VHLVEDANLPWYLSSDHLNRPLRDGLFRLLPAVFGLNPVPFRMLAFVFYGVTVWLLFQFVRKLGMGQAAALTAAVLFAFFPRNREGPFWFAAFQDLVVSTLIMFACIAWLSYLRSRGLGSFLAAHCAYIVALGFKETSIGLPVVLFGLELITANPVDFTVSGLWQRLRKYWLFVPIAAALVVFVLLLGSHASDAQRSKGIYIGTSALGVIPPLARTFVNIILQFGTPIAVRDLRGLHLLVVALGCGSITVAVRLSANRKLACFSLVWFLIFALPTAAFARSVNADRYLALPYIAIILILAGAVNQLEPLNAAPAALLAVALLVTPSLVAATSPIIGRPTGNRPN